MIIARASLTHNQEIIRWLRFNVHANTAWLSVNGVTIFIAPLSWGEAGDMELIRWEFDVILASDVVYHDHLYEPLFQTLYLAVGW